MNAVTERPITDRLETLGIDTLRRVVEALPESNPAWFMRSLDVHAAELAGVRAQIAALQTHAALVEAKIGEDKRRLSSDIYHAYNLGEISDALQECGL